MTAPAPLLDPTPHALCAEHTDRRALSTCSRCGRFMCGGCITASGACIGCAAMQLDALPVLEARTRKAVGGLYANVGVEIAAALLAFGLLLGSQSDAILMLIGFVGLAVVVVYVTTVVLYLRWLHLAVRTANARGIDVGATPGWAVGWWFIPFANLVKPYHTVRALVAGLGGEGAVASAGVGTWWALWVVGNIASNVEARMTSFADDGISTTAGIVGAISSLLSIAAAIYCIRVIRAVQSGFRSGVSPTSK